MNLFKIIPLHERLNNYIKVRFKIFNDKEN